MQPRVWREFGQMQQESACSRQDRWREPHPQIRCAQQSLYSLKKLAQLYVRHGFVRS